MNLNINEDEEIMLIILAFISHFKFSKFLTDLLK